MRSKSGLRAALVLCAVGTVALFGSFARVQASEPGKRLLGFPPGGGIDMVAPSLQPALQDIALVRAENEKWIPVIQASGVKVE
jgi:tripartite-type tricarboxylate transporter receptor subunit TctC